MVALTRLSALLVLQVVLLQVLQTYAEECDPKVDPPYRCNGEKVAERCWKYPYNDIYFYQPLDICPQYMLCSIKSEYSYTCLNAIKCVQPGRFPDLESDRCTSYYDCPDDAADDNIITALPKVCPSGFQYNPCSRKCDIAYSGNCRVNYTTCSQSPTVLPDNPSLFYSCANEYNVAYWRKCTEGFFLDQSGKCTGTGNICP